MVMSTPMMHRETLAGTASLDTQNDV